MIIQQRQFALFLFFIGLVFQINSSNEDRNKLNYYNSLHIAYIEGEARAETPSQQRFNTIADRLDSQIHRPRNFLQPHYPHPQQCADRIKKSPYALEVYHKNHSTQVYIANVNHHCLPIKIKARILLLEAALPPPYDKKLKKALRKFAKKTADSNNNLLDSLNDIDEKTFKDFLDLASLNVQHFHEHIDQIEKHKNKNIQGAPRTAQSSCLINIIDHQADWSYDRLTQECDRGSCYGNIVQQLYNHYTRERFYAAENQALIQRDPVWKSATSAQHNDPSFQSHLLLRSLYVNRLKKAFSEGAQLSESAINSMYKIVGEEPDLRRMPTGCEQAMINKIIEQSCFNFAECPEDFKPILFGATGVLKKYSAYSFVREHLSQQQLDYSLQRAVNLALLTKEKNDSLQAQSACEQVLHNTAQHLHLTDSDLYRDYKNEACNISDQLEKKLFPEPQLAAMDSEKIEEFNNLWDRFYGENKARTQACEAAVKTGLQDFTKQHELTPEIKGFMQAYCINQFYFSHVHGNAFQHHITGELLQIIQKTAHVKHEFSSDIANFAELGQGFNLVKKLNQAVAFTDVCWGLLKYGEAVGLGLKDTANSMIEIAQDPVKYLCDVATGVGTLAFNMVKYGYDFVFVPEEARDTEAYLLQLCRDLKKAYDRSTGPERTRFGVHFISESVLTRKAISHVHKFIGSLAQAARNRTTWDAAQSIKFIHNDAQAGRRFMGDVIYYCEDEIKSTQLGAKYKKGIVKDVGHRHLIARPSKICKTSTAQLVAVQKNATQPFTEKNITPEMITRALINTAQSGAPAPHKFFQPIVAKKFLPAISHATRETQNKIIAFITVLKERIKALVKRDGAAVRKRYFATKYDDLSPEEKLKSNYCEMIRARQKLSNLLPTCEDSIDKATLVTLQGPQIVKFLDGEVLTKIRIFHCSCSKLKFSLEKPWEPAIDGGHLNRNKIFQDREGFKFKITAQKNGCSVAEMKIAQAKAFHKTLYPNSWDPIIIDAKIREALTNVISVQAIVEKKLTIIKTVQDFKSNNFKRCDAVSKTSEGIHIKIAIEKNENGIEVISAYPDRNWIEGKSAHNVT